MKLLPYLTALAVLASCAYKNKEADLVVHNARIVTLDSVEHVYEAMAIKDGRIVELGPEQQILNRYRAKESYDAAGRTVYPGFVDGHCHFLGYGLNKQKVDLSGAKSWSEVLARTAAFAKAHPERTWIIGRGWDQNQWPSKATPVNDSLDLLFPDKPVLLQRIDGHAAMVNSAALRSTGLTAQSSIRGGILEVRNGKPTGLLVDNAVDVFQKIFDDADEASKRKALLDAQRDCFDAGLTMVCDAGLDAGTIHLIQRMQDEGVLKMRIYAMVADKPENLDQFTSGPVIRDRLIVRAVKVYADGALGSRGALLIAPYELDSLDRIRVGGLAERYLRPSAVEDSMTKELNKLLYGLQLCTRAHLDSVAQWCKQHGFQMATHCIGDSANRLLLSVYGQALGGSNDLRWRIEHAQCVDPADLPLFQRYSVIPSVQPTHATSDMAWAAKRIGAERLKNAYAYEALLKQNGLLALGTDFPVEGIDPLATFYAAVVRKNKAGEPDGGFQMENALTRDQALRGMTIWNALATFTENDLGTLEVGKRADLTVVDRDLLTADGTGLRKAKVVATFVNGERVDSH